MTPIWIFPAYPMLIIGPHAATLSAVLPQREALQVIIGGTTVQGVGFLVSLTVYSAFIYRLMTQKLPKENLRPGMFVSVGPSAFTVAGVVGMAENTARSLPSDFMGDGELTAKVLRILANFSALWLWGWVKHGPLWKPLLKQKIDLPYSSFLSRYLRIGLQSAAVEWYFPWLGILLYSQILPWWHQPLLLARLLTVTPSRHLVAPWPSCYSLHIYLSSLWWSEL